MPLLFIKMNGRQQTIPFVPGESLQDVLAGTSLRLRSGCGGTGTCGLCSIRIKEGNVNRPTKKERLVLSGKELQQGIRLACQMVPEGDLQITIENPPPDAGWRKLEHSSMPWMTSPPEVFRNLASSEDGPYGVAVDMGTTNISLTLWDLERGRRLSGRFGSNRQFYFGSDVMTRLVAASGSVKTAKEISRTARRSIADALEDMCSGEGWNPKKITRISIVGNTPMLSLLAGKNFDRLLRPEYWTQEVDCFPEDTKGWFDSAGVDPEAVVDIIQPLAGFVGSDLIAGVLATRLAEQVPGSLLIDFGTNSEIALWDGNNLWTTSAAGGPAFEGGGIRCGMPAEPGAIFRLDLANNPETGRAESVIKVIGGGEAKGFCGSGMVDAVAYLLRTGKLNYKGKIIPQDSDPENESRPALIEGIPGLFLDNSGIDFFQRAKAAIGAGVMVLLKHARLHVADLQRICVCGTFGRYLNLQNAQEIGLLPTSSHEFFELCGNTALSGCEILLLSPAGKEDISAVRKRTKLINLAQAPEFEDMFLENLYLRPMKEY